MYVILSHTSGQWPSNQLQTEIETLYMHKLARG